MATAMGAGDLFKIVRQGIDVKAVDRHIRKPFRFLLCGDLGLVAEMRALLLSGHPDGEIPFDAGACLETISHSTPLVAGQEDVHAIIFLGRRGDLGGADLSALLPLKVPILGITVDPSATPGGPHALPHATKDGFYPIPAEYVVASIDRESLRPRFFPHLVECARGVEIAVGRRLPVLRESVAAKLTRDAAGNSLKVALASAVVDHIPLVGVVLGAVASAGDMVAITGIQVVLMLHIEAAYGRDPDVRRVWQLLPVIGGGFGWRALARELSGFVPVAGIAIKGAIAYAGTIVVGEGVTFFLEHGKHMTKGQAAATYKRTKEEALRFGRELLDRVRKNKN